MDPTVNFHENFKKNFGMIQIYKREKKSGLT